VGANTPIYQEGDIQESQPEVSTTVVDVLDDLYELRNVIAHGDRTPAKFFVEARHDYGDVVTNSLR
jgi:hypothetical protein